MKKEKQGLTHITVSKTTVEINSSMPLDNTHKNDYLKLLKKMLEEYEKLHKEESKKSFKVMIRPTEVRTKKGGTPEEHSSNQHPKTEEITHPKHHGQLISDSKGKALPLHHDKCDHESVNGSLHYNGHPISKPNNSHDKESKETLKKHGHHSKIAKGMKHVKSHGSHGKHGRESKRVKHPRYHKNHGMPLKKNRHLAEESMYKVHSDHHRYHGRLSHKNKTPYDNWHLVQELMDKVHSKHHRHHGRPSHESRQFYHHRHHADDSKGKVHSKHHMSYHRGEDSKGKVHPKHHMHHGRPPYKDMPSYHHAEYSKDKVHAKHHMHHGRPTHKDVPPYHHGHLADNLVHLNHQQRHGEKSEMVHPQHHGQLKSSHKHHAHYDIHKKKHHDKGIVIDIEGPDGSSRIKLRISNKLKTKAKEKPHSVKDMNGIKSAVKDRNGHRNVAEKMDWLYAPFSPGYDHSKSKKAHVTKDAFHASRGHKNNPRFGHRHAGAKPRKSHIANDVHHKPFYGHHLEYHRDFHANRRYKAFGHVDHAHHGPGYHQTKLWKHHLDKHLKHKSIDRHHHKDNHVNRGYEHFGPYGPEYGQPESWETFMMKDLQHKSSTHHPEDHRDFYANGGYKRHEHENGYFGTRRGHDKLREHHITNPHYENNRDFHADRGYDNSGKKETNSKQKKGQAFVEAHGDAKSDASMDEKHGMSNQKSMSSVNGAGEGRSMMVGKHGVKTETRVQGIGKGKAKADSQLVEDAGEVHSHVIAEVHGGDDRASASLGDASITSAPLPVVPPSTSEHLLSKQPGSGAGLGPFRDSVTMSPPVPGTQSGQQYPTKEPDTGKTNTLGNTAKDIQPVAPPSSPASTTATVEDSKLKNSLLTDQKILNHIIASLNHHHETHSDLPLLRKDAAVTSGTATPVTQSTANPNPVTQPTVTPNPGGAIGSQGSHQSDHLQQLSQVAAGMGAHEAKAVVNKTQGQALAASSNLDGHVGSFSDSAKGQVSAVSTGDQGKTIVDVDQGKGQAAAQSMGTGGETRAQADGGTGQASGSVNGLQSKYIVKAAGRTGQASADLLSPKGKATSETDSINGRAKAKSSDLVGIHNGGRVDDGSFHPTYTNDRDIGNANSNSNSFQGQDGLINQLKPYYRAGDQHAIYRHQEDKNHLNTFTKDDGSQFYKPQNSDINVDNSRGPAHAHSVGRKGVIDDSLTGNGRASFDAFSGMHDSIPDGLSLQPADFKEREFMQEYENFLDFLQKRNIEINPVEIQRVLRQHLARLKREQCRDCGREHQAHQEHVSLQNGNRPLSIRAGQKEEQGNVIEHRLGDIRVKVKVLDRHTRNTPSSMDAHDDKSSSSLTQGLDTQLQEKIKEILSGDRKINGEKVERKGGEMIQGEKGVTHDFHSSTKHDLKEATLHIDIKARLSEKNAGHKKKEKETPLKEDTKTEEIDNVLKDISIANYVSGKQDSKSHKVDNLGTNMDTKTEIRKSKPESKFDFHQQSVQQKVKEKETSKKSEERFVYIDQKNRELAHLDNFIKSSHYHDHEKKVPTTEIDIEFSKKKHGGIDKKRNKPEDDYGSKIARIKLKGPDKNVVMKHQQGKPTNTEIEIEFPSSKHSSNSQKKEGVVTDMARIKVKDTGTDEKGTENHMHGKKLTRTEIEIEFPKGKLVGKEHQDTSEKQENRFVSEDLNWKRPYKSHAQTQRKNVHSLDHHEMKHWKKVHRTDNEREPSHGVIHGKEVHFYNHDDDIKTYHEMMHDREMARTGDRIDPFHKLEHGRMIHKADNRMKSLHGMKHGEHTQTGTKTKSRDERFHNKDLLRNWHDTHIVSHQLGRRVDAHQFPKTDIKFGDHHRENHHLRNEGRKWKGISGHNLNGDLYDEHLLRNRHLSVIPGHQAQLKRLHGTNFHNNYHKMMMHGIKEDEGKSRKGSHHPFHPLLNGHFTHKQGIKIPKAEIKIKFHGKKYRMEKNKDIPKKSYGMGKKHGSLKKYDLYEEGFLGVHPPKGVPSHQMHVNQKPPSTEIHIKVHNKKHDIEHYKGNLKRYDFHGTHEEQKPPSTAIHMKFHGKEHGRERKPSTDIHVKFHGKEHGMERKPPSTDIHVKFHGKDHGMERKPSTDINVKFHGKEHGMERKPSTDIHVKFHGKEHEMERKPPNTDIHVKFHGKEHGMERKPSTDINVKFHGKELGMERKPPSTDINVKFHGKEHGIGRKPSTDIHVKFHGKEHEMERKPPNTDINVKFHGKEHGMERKPSNTDINVKFHGKENGMERNKVILNEKDLLEEGYFGNVHPWKVPPHRTHENEELLLNTEIHVKFHGKEHGMERNKVIPEEKYLYKEDHLGDVPHWMIHPHRTHEQEEHPYRDHHVKFHSKKHGMINKYGRDHHVKFHSKKHGMINKYGRDHHVKFHSKKHGMINKYGRDHHVKFHSKKHGMINKYGRDHHVKFHSKKHGMINKYGRDHHVKFHSKKHGMINKYGRDHHVKFHSKKHGMINKYGRDHHVKFHSKKHGMINKYGRDHYVKFHSKKHGMINKYGRDHHVKFHRKKHRMINKYGRDHHVKFHSKNHEMINKYGRDHYVKFNRKKHGMINKYGRDHYVKFHRKNYGMINKYGRDHYVKFHSKKHGIGKHVFDEAGYLGDFRPWKIPPHQTHENEEHPYRDLHEKFHSKKHRMIMEHGRDHVKFHGKKHGMGRHEFDEDGYLGDFRPWKIRLHETHEEEEHPYRDHHEKFHSKKHGMGKHEYDEAGHLGDLRPWEVPLHHEKERRRYPSTDIHRKFHGRPEENRMRGKTHYQAHKEKFLEDSRPFLGQRPGPVGDGGHSKGLHESEGKLMELKLKNMVQQIITHTQRLERIKDESIGKCCKFYLIISIFMGSGRPMFSENTMM